jgi:hypothetical protein
MLFRENQGPRDRQHFLATHWHGGFSLPRAFWVNTLFPLLVWTRLTGFIAASGLTLLFGMRASGLWSLGVFLVGATFSVWAGVGAWRSAARHVARGGRALWGRLVVALCALELLVLVSSTATQATILHQSFMLALGRDTVPAANLRVLNHETEVEISGGLSFGTAGRLESLLDSKPTIRSVRLESSGGWIAEGSKLAEIVARHKLTTRTSRECESACLLVFVAGEHRFLGPKAVLGFHEASIAGIGGEIASQGTEILRDALERRGVPQAFIQEALTTPPSSIWYPTTDELIAAHVVTAIVAEPAESISRSSLLAGV